MLLVHVSACECDPLVITWPLLNVVDGHVNMLVAAKLVSC